MNDRPEPVPLSDEIITEIELLLAADRIAAGLLLYHAPRHGGIIEAVIEGGELQRGALIECTTGEAERCLAVIKRMSSGTRAVVHTPGHA